MMSHRGVRYRRSSNTLHCYIEQLINNVALVQMPLEIAKLKEPQLPLKKALISPAVLWNERHEAIDNCIPELG